MTTADEIALCEAIIDQFETTGLGKTIAADGYNVGSTTYPPFASSITRVARTKVFSATTSGPSGFSDIFTDVFTDNTGTGSAGGWVAAPSRVRLNRPMPELFTGQNPPYDPVFSLRWCKAKWHNCHTKTVRTIEQFAAFTLHGDGIPGGGQQQPNGTDDTVAMNDAIARALRFAHDNQNTDLVVSFTRTYICNNTLTLSPDRIAALPVPKPPNGLQNPHPYRLEPTTFGRRRT